MACGKMSADTWVSRIFLAGVMAVGAVTALGGISPSEVQLVPCLFHELTGWCCPGCGMTRSCTALAQGSFMESWEYHPLGFMLVGLAVYVAVWPGHLRKSWARFSRPSQVAVMGAGYVLVLTVWIGRLATGF